MRIEFDSSNPSELNAVFVAILVLRGGDISIPELFADDSETSGAPAPAAAPAAPTPAPIEAVADALPPPAPPAAVAPPLPPAPAAPAPAPAAGPGGVELDADGLPYDKRIHANPPSKKKDGKWRGKRGLDDATRQAVTAELRAALAAPAPAPAAPAPMFEESAPGVPLPPEPAVDAATAFGAGDAGNASNAPPPPPAPAPVVPPPPAPAPAPVAPPPPAPAPAPAAPAAPVAEGPATDFASLMKKITARQAAGKLTVAGTTEIAVSLGLTGVRDLMVRPDLIPSVDALLPELG